MLVSETEIARTGLVARKKGSLAAPFNVWWSETDLNRRHGDFQSPALPTELPDRKRLYSARRYCTGRPSGGQALPANVSRETLARARRETSRARGGRRGAFTRCNARAKRERSFPGFAARHGWRKARDGSAARSGSMARGSCKAHENRSDANTDRIVPLVLQARRARAIARYSLAQPSPKINSLSSPVRAARA